MSSISFPSIRKTGLVARAVRGARHIRHRIALTLGGKGELEVRRSHSLSLGSLCSMMKQRMSSMAWSSGRRFTSTSKLLGDFITKTVTSRYVSKHVSLSLSI